MLGDRSGAGGIREPLCQLSELFGHLKELLVHRLEALIDSGLEALEFLTFRRGQTRLAMLADQVATSLIDLPPGFLVRDRSQGTAEEVLGDSLG
jgi:hypothetical protein